MKCHRFHRLLISLTAGLLFCLSAGLYSQTPKGVITTNEKTLTNGKTRALVIGISRYQFIDTLQFAANDAEYFADYLRHSSFWNIAREDITLLINDKAKYGDLTVQLQQIVLQCKPGDNLLFYFSGHGDVETNTLFNRGFLLAQDTYSSNYMANGLRVDDLKDLFVTLLSNQVKVIVITDACRSGKLAGGMKGAEYTAAAMMNNWKNEIKILSSQPGQLSYEDRKWGNGRGVFSYYLVNGLNGEADVNKDSTITLAELEMYVGANVARETNNQQQPIFEGPNKFSAVITRTGTISGPGAKKAGNSRRVQWKNSWQPADSCDYYFEQMTGAIREKQLLSPETGSAIYFYQHLKRCSKDQSFTLQANGQLLSSLMNNCQEIINNSFIGKSLVAADDFKEGVSLINEIFRLNDLRLPHLNHWRNLQRYLYVLGEATWNERSRTDLLDKIIDSAAREEPEAAYLLTAKAVVEMKKENWDAAINLLEKSLEKSPGWLVPKYNLGICYGYKKNYRKALSYYEDIFQKDSSFRTFECTKCILLKMAEYSIKTKQFTRGIDYHFRNIAMFPDHAAPYNEIYDYAIDHRDSLVARRFSQVLRNNQEQVAMKLLALRFENEFYKTPLSRDSLDQVIPLLKNEVDSSDYFYTLALYFQEPSQEDNDSAHYYYRQAIQLDSTELYYWNVFGRFLESAGLYEELLEEITPALSLFEEDERFPLKGLLLNAHLALDQKSEAFTILKEMKELGYLTCADLRKFRKEFKGLPEYEAFLKNCHDKD